MGARRVLVIEDDVQMAQMIAAMLMHHGYESLIASDGVEAVSKLMGNVIHLILLDIMMPFFSGYWFCDVFKKNPVTQHIPVVIVSALDKPSDVEKGLKLGADAYVTKPFTEETLIRAIDSIFAKTGAKAAKKTKRRK